MAMRRRILLVCVVLATLAGAGPAEAEHKMRCNYQSKQGYYVFYVADDDTKGHRCYEDGKDTGGATGLGRVNVKTSDVQKSSQKAKSVEGE